MKSFEEIRVVHDLLARVLAGQYPVNFSRRDLAFLQAQYDVLCFAMCCEGNDNFQKSMESLKDLLGQAHVFRHGRKFKSQALVE